MSVVPPAAAEKEARDAWEWVEFGSLFEIQQGKALDPAAREGTDQYPFLRTSNILWGRISPHITDTMAFSTEERSKYELNPGDLLVCEGGEVGRAAVWSGDQPNVFYQNHLHRCRAIRARVEPDFFSFWLRYGMLLGQLYPGSANTTTIANLSKSRLGSFSVPCPPVEEQRAIAHVLRTVQRAQERTGQVITAAKDLKRSLLQHLFTYGPVKKSETSTIRTTKSDIGDVPDTWEVLPLEEVATLQRGFDITKNEQQSGPYPVVSSSGVQSSHIEYKVAGPGVVVGRKGSAGEVYFVEPDFWPHDTTLWVKDFHGNRPDFVFYLLSRFDFRPYITGVANPSLNRNHVHPATVGVPPLDEQKQIAEMLYEAEGKISSEERRCDALDAVFDSLLYNLMSARLRVHDLDLEVV